MHKIKFIFPFLIVLTSGIVKAQQLPIYSQYMLNDFSMNPAIAGTQDYFNVKSDNRFQWIGITDAPRTYVLTFDGPVASQHIGFGTYVFTDITGPTRRTGLTTSYSYHVQLSKTVNLSFGLSAGVLQFAVDGQSISLQQTGDQALVNQLMSAVVPDFAAGVYLYSSNFYFGFAAPQIIPITAKLNSYADAQDIIVTHYYTTAGYNFNLGNNFSFKPCVVANYVYPVPPQFDLGARILYMNKFWIGGGYRTLDAAYAMLGYVYQKNLTIGFSYDYPITDIHEYSVGTTELYIGITFNKTKKAPVPSIEE
ncbi:MAG TPA: type IX secretion system membrane protein PorP/SprF [Bacteroidia bacterium]|nr:type IX secretion system membrane protein PorP/SprF [Bacteroidia bacterium]